MAAVWAIWVLVSLAMTLGYGVVVIQRMLP
jgi:hypothetical protein